MQELIDQLKKKFTQELPGMASHIKLAPEKRADELAALNGRYDSAKKSAVMILLFEEREVLKVVFIRRSFYVGIHAGQIAFPGGRYEEEDKNTLQTAYREVEEEIGIQRNEIELIAQLSDIYVPPSNFLVSVYVGFLRKKPVYRPDEREVHSMIEIELNDFLKNDVILRKNFRVPSTNQSINAPYYQISQHEIWGVSAMIMSEFLELYTHVN